MTTAIDLGCCRLRPLAEGEKTGLAAAVAALDPWRTLGFGAEKLAHYLGREDPALRRLVIETGHAVGLLTLRSPWLRGPYVELLAVLPEAQGQGLGKAAVGWAADEAARGWANLWTCVSAFNAPARAFYQAQGFTEAARLPGLVAPGFDELLLRKPLHS